MKHHVARLPLFFSHPFSLFVSDEPSEQSVFVMLNGEESELRFLNIANPTVSNNLSVLLVSYQLENILFEQDGVVFDYYSPFDSLRTMVHGIYEGLK